MRRGGSVVVLDTRQPPHPACRTFRRSFSESPSPRSSWRCRRLRGGCRSQRRSFSSWPGLALGLAPGIATPELDPDLVFFVFLPPILWSAAMFTSPREFRRNIGSISLLAVGLVLVTTAVVAIAAHALMPGMPWAVAVALGAIVSPPRRGGGDGNRLASSRAASRHHSSRRGESRQRRVGAGGVSNRGRRRGARQLQLGRIRRSILHRRRDWIAHRIARGLGRDLGDVPHDGTRSPKRCSRSPRPTSRG